MYEGKFNTFFKNQVVHILFKGKLGKHTVGMAYRQGYLEVTDDVRSVPLGVKRKRGRPKKLGPCLAKSPARGSQTVDAPTDDQAAVAPTDDVQAIVALTDDDLGTTSSEMPRRVENADDEESDNLLEIAPPVRVSTRKRRRIEDESVCTDLSPVDILVKQSGGLKPGLGSSKPTKKAKKQHISSPIRPRAIACVKSKNACNHEVVFGKHYDKSRWIKYADHVKSKKSSVVIDPDY